MQAFGKRAKESTPTYELPLLAKVQMELAKKEITQESKYLMLYLAADEGNIEAAKLILDSGVDLSKTLASSTHSSQTPLMRAAYKGHAEIVAMILEHCKDDKLIKQTDGKTQATALHCAVANKNIRKEDTDQYVRIINNLIEHGAELEARDINGLTPLHYACRQTAKSKLIRALIDAGADTTIKWSGMTAYDFLKARLDSAEGYTPSEGQKETLKMLQAYNTVRPFSGCKLSAMSPKLHLMDEPSV